MQNENEFSKLRVKYNSPLPTINNKDKNLQEIQLIFLIGKRRIKNAYNLRIVAIILLQHSKADPTKERTALAKQIVNNYDGLIHLDMNELLIQNLTQNQGTNKNFDKKLIDKTLKAIKNNEPISNDLMLDTLSLAIKKYQESNTIKACLVEGFPRNEGQALDWEKYV